MSLEIVPSALISEFYSSALAGDEYFSISCVSGPYVCLRDWVVSDGEGEIRFISDLMVTPGVQFRVSFNSSSFWSAFNSLPDVALDMPGASTMATMGGSFRLADSGDNIMLRSPDGAVVDSVVYGAANGTVDGWDGSPVPMLRMGEVAKRLERSGLLIDSNTSDDWQPFREFRYGYTQLSPRSFDVSAGGIVSFTSPDCSLEVVSRGIDRARETVLVCTYELSSASVSERLIAAIARGVRVRVLVDGAPVGGLSDTEIACLSALRSAGAEVRTLNGNVSAGVVQHVGALHSKYMVVDSTRSIVLSENFADDGVPSDVIFGNRGWGVEITSVGLSEYLTKMFESDSRSNRPDVCNWESNPRYTPGAVLPDRGFVDANASHLSPFATSNGAVVTVLPSPDSSWECPYLTGYLRADDSLMVEQFQADLFWTSRWTDERYLNPLLGAVTGSADRGADVSALFDSAWFNLQRNTPVVDHLNTGLPVPPIAKLIDQRSPISLLHNKGAIVDGLITAITSNNWVSASFAKNRELAVIVRSQEVANHFAQAFAYDWIPDEKPPICDAGPDIEIRPGETALLDASASVDDRLIANFSWDVDADGVVDDYGLTAIFDNEVAGDHVIVLTVLDSWGNAASDEVHVLVVAPTSDVRASADGRSPGYLWTIPAALAVGILVARLMRRRKTVPHARNLNHRPRS